MMMMMMMMMMIVGCVKSNFFSTLGFSSEGQRHGFVEGGGFTSTIVISMFHHHLRESCFAFSKHRPSKSKKKNMKTIFF